MNEQGLISDNSYPIQPIWALRNSISSLIGMPFGMLFLYFWAQGEAKGQIDNPIFFFFVFFFAGFGPLIHFISNLIKRARFHFTFEENYLTLKQGLFSKQMRHLPYGVIQNITVTQGVFDRFFGLASLKIENAADSGGAGILGLRTTQATQQKMEQNMVGFAGNKVVIPGLSLDHCNFLKGSLEEKVKINSVNPNQSGI